MGKLGPVWTWPAEQWAFPVRQLNGGLNGKPVLAKPSINGQVNDDGRNVQHKLASGTLRLSGLLGQDEGNYSCHATNGHGSDSVVYQVTVDRDKGQSEEESPPPVIRIANTTAKSIIVEWKSKAFPSSSLSNLMFYSPLAVAQEVYFKNVISTASEWKQLVLNENGHDNGSFTINNLVCGTQYKVYSVLVYPVGKSRPSQVVIGKTQGREPLSSPASVFITRLDKNAVQLNLNTWRNGGCPLIEGQVQWRNVQDKPWNVLAINSLSEPVVLSGLNSEHLYKIRVTLKNTAGTTTVEYEARTSPFKISNVMYRSPSDTSEHISLDSYNVVHGDDAAIQGPLIVTSFVTLILLLAALLSVIVLYKTIQNKLVHGNHGHIISTNSVAMAHSHPANTKIPFMSNVGPSDFVSGAELAVLTVPAHEASTLCSRTRKQQQKKLRTSCSDTAFDALTSFGPNDQDQVLETPYQYLTVSRTSFSGPHKKLPPLNGGEYATVDKKNYTKAKMNSSNHHASGLPSVVSLGLGISNFSGHGGHQDQSSSPRYSTPKTPTSGLILDETINFDQRLSVLTACDSIASSDNGHEQSQHQQHGGYCYTSVLNDPHADGGYSYPGNQHWPDKHDFRSKQHDDSMLFN
ncbi:Down syndrome cell adhesion molecule-like protein 1 [Halotydeus destructor]|nr:Down syndrome cell adhesion molecule-like protein 1 [Halotydeus destructor]